MMRDNPRREEGSETPPGRGSGIVTVHNKPLWIILGVVAVLIVGSFLLGAS